MKNFKKLTYAATFLLAIGLSFAFTNKKAAYTGTVYYQDQYGNCTEYWLNDPDDECDTSNSGSICTIMDPNNPGIYTAIYATWGGPGFCLQPLRSWF